MIEIKRGDRRSLTGAELTTLDEKVLPTARRWLREYPHLAHHAVATLSHWNEPLIDDQRRLKYLDRLDAYLWAEHHRPDITAHPGWVQARQWLDNEWIDLERIAA